MSYTYDANGERVLKSNTSTGAAVKRYWSMGGNTLAEGDGSGNLTAEYIYFGGKRVARIDLPANTVHYYLSDHLGSTSIVASAAGVVEEESDYYPFGTEVIVAGPGVNELKFTGKRRDAESQLDYFSARYFDSPFGRFMTPDPIMIMKQKLLDPQQWNMYAYTRNNPLRFTDPTGKYTCKGTKDQCERVKKAYEATQRAADAAKADGKTKEYKQLSSVLKFLGKPGEANYVSVKFGDLSKDTLAQTDTQKVSLGPAGGSVTTTSITFDLKQMDSSAATNNHNPLGSAGVNDTAGVLTHEGTHGRDRLPFGTNPQTKAEARSTETNAYTNESYIFTVLNARSSFGFWNPNLPADSAEQNRIDAIKRGVQGSLDAAGW
jgi:RHS repeat-associated protein